VSETVNVKSSKHSAEFDIVISGAGVVGCLTAIALATHTSFRILLLEAFDSTAKKPNNEAEARFDARVVALAGQSLNILADLGLNIEEIAHQAIEQIHVSDRGHIGQVKLNAKEHNIEALGKVVAIEALGEHLLEKVKRLGVSVQYRCPVNIEQATQSQSEVTLQLSDSTQVATKLLIVSDGGHSKTASLVGMHSQAYSYKQAAIITNIKTQLPHKNIAYERFTSQGPIAFLPMNAANGNGKLDQHSMSVVWCMHEEYAQEKRSLNEPAFLQELLGLFGHKLGKFEACSARFSYPLSLVKTNSFTAHRALCVGNAAQSLHPIAGQGFNLGVRDVAGLIDVLKYADDPGDFNVTLQYKKDRQADKDATILATETLVKVFSNQYAPLVLARNIGLLALNGLALPKQRLANFAMGTRKRHA